jgi:hypothetical protein
MTTPPRLNIREYGHQAIFKAIGFPTWFGSQTDCIEAAVTGKWRGDLK